MRYRRCGDQGVLIEVDGPVLSLLAAARDAELPGVQDLVPGDRTLLVLARSAGRPRPAAAHAPGPPAGRCAGGCIDGTGGAGDLRRRGPAPSSRTAWGVEPEAVVRRHVEATWTVAFTGFSPGFGYLRTAIRTGRRSPAGSRRAPGCPPGRWRWPATTRASIRATPQVGGNSSGAPGSTSSMPIATHRPCSGRDAASGSGRSIRRERRRARSRQVLTVVDPGLLSTLQDTGRPGHAHLGVPPSGAMDRAAATGGESRGGQRDRRCLHRVDLRPALGPVRCRLHRRRDRCRCHRVRAPTRGRIRPWLRPSGSGPVARCTFAWSAGCVPISPCAAGCGQPRVRSWAASAPTC